MPPRRQIIAFNFDLLRVAFFALSMSASNQAWSVQVGLTKERIESIEARLESRSAFHALSNANKSRMLGMLYESEQWERLSEAVWEYGLNFDVSYLYLGRIALEAGHFDLAERLLKKSVSHSPKHSCLFTDVCHKVEVRVEAFTSISKLENVRLNQGGNTVLASGEKFRPSESLNQEDIPSIGSPQTHLETSRIVDAETSILKPPKDPQTVEDATKEAAREAELTAARLENERLRQQLQASQKTPSVDKPSNNAIAETPKPHDSKISSGAKRHALIIGNNDYRNVPKLDNAVGDARSIAALLSKLEYEVVAHNNLGEKQFRTALRQFKQKLKGGEEVIFFFAGHGVQLGSANYLLPTDIGSDSEDQIRDEGIALQRVLDDFSESRAKFSLAVVDACRDNPFKSTGRSIGGRGLASTSAATGQMIIFSAGAGQQALDRLGRNDKEKNGLFTRVLIDKVGKSKDPIHLLMRDVRSEVAKLAQTVGHEQVPAIYDQVIGDFYFIPRR